eukprot:TRINITY_DN38488_c0_g2_i1.p1 TRINITY_DN38488_c0_g2~~TRINITY_DN38488_c0_g2_i1.p1  ORF type:complete len:884 (+),score=234.76 TRINITY_DN38488_c0_g2_i1:63-2714(+)
MHDGPAAAGGAAPTTTAAAAMEAKRKLQQSGSGALHENHALSVTSVEDGRMYKFDPADPHGHFAMQSDQKRLRGTASLQLDAKRLLRRLRPSFGRVYRLMLQDEPQDTEVSTSVGLLLNDLYRCRDARKCAAYVRRVDASSVEDVSRYLTAWYVKAAYWVCPVILFATCFCVQSILLHIATHFYIRYMQALRRNVVLSTNSTGVSTTEVLEAEMIRQGQLYDLMETLEPPEDVPLLLLDLSGILPTVLFCLTYVVCFGMGHSNIGLWTKTFLVASAMALLKGTCDVLTIVPDSGGWDSCEKRLGAEGVEHLGGSLDFDGSFFSSMGSLILLELLGGDGGRVRYCADMLVSGHTYFATLFSLSTYKAMKYVTQAKKTRWLRYVVGLFCASCVITEVVLVSIAKFHYTVDMFLAMIFVIILWDSVYVETLASEWVRGYHWRDPSWYESRCAQQEPAEPKAGLARQPRLQKTREICTSSNRKLLNLRMVRPLLLDDPDVDSAATSEADEEEKEEPLTEADVEAGMALACGAAASAVTIVERDAKLVAEQPVDVDVAPPMPESPAPSSKQGASVSSAALSAVLEQMRDDSARSARMLEQKELALAESLQAQRVAERQLSQALVERQALHGEVRLLQAKSEAMHGQLAQSKVLVVEERQRRLQFEQEAVAAAAAAAAKMQSPPPLVHSEPLEQHVMLQLTAEKLRVLAEEQRQKRVEAETLLRQMQLKLQDAEQRAFHAEQLASHAEQHAAEAVTTAAREAEKRVAAAEARAAAAERRAETSEAAERRSVQDLRSSQQQLADANFSADEAERRARAVEQEAVRRQMEMSGAFAELRALHQSQNAIRSELMGNGALSMTGPPPIAYGSAAVPVQMRKDFFSNSAWAGRR